MSPPSDHRSPSSTISLEAFCAREVASFEEQGLKRWMRPVVGPQGHRLSLEGKSYENFSSNDYLGLAAHPTIQQRARETLDTYGTGSGASPLITGCLEPMRALQTSLAQWKQCEATLVFNSGYAAALGTLTALVGPQDILILDKLCHACLIDAARMSQATLRVFAHNHLEQLEQRLAWARETMAKRPASDRGRVGVVVESIYSMDGDAASIPSIVELKDRYEAWLMVDEAHATGIFGPHGAGWVHELGMQDRVEIQMGTMGKALGASGGFIAGSFHLIEYLKHRARSLVFSTAPSPVVCGAAMAAVELIQTKEGQRQRERLHLNIRTLQGAIPPKWRSGGAQDGAMGWLHPGNLATPIMAWMAGSTQGSLNLSDSLAEHGFWVPAIRYPTVSRNGARLRVSLSAAHSPNVVEDLAARLVETSASYCSPS